MVNKISVVELFAGVGGFRLGLEGYKGKSASSGYLESYNSPYKVIWSNQYEPATPTVQHASNIYVRHFGEAGHTNKDIANVLVSEIPVHELLVGGFPCQDYSVAKGFKATGLEGTKGALWWEIHRILQHKRPPYLLLENVDRLRNNPHQERGRDFAIVLASLGDLGYVVEWRVIDASAYGMPQRRKRIYLVGYQKDTALAMEYLANGVAFDWISRKGILANAFPLSFKAILNSQLSGTVQEIAKDFQLNGLNIDSANESSRWLLALGRSRSPFHNAGLMVERTFFTGDATPVWDGEEKHLGDIVERNGCVPAHYFISAEALPKWERLKGKKNLVRVHKESGTEYPYAEGAVTFPDRLDRASRTVVTGEGGSGASRFKHVIMHPDSNEYRRLTPVEIERLNMFPDNFTEGLPDTRRAFLMGNSVVIGVIERIAAELASRI